MAYSPVKKQPERKMIDQDDEKAPKTGTYASAKKKDKNLDTYIKTRNNAKPGSSDYNAAQNKINAAYGKGPTNRKVKVADGTKTSTGVMKNQANQTKAEKIVETGAGPNAKPSKAPKSLRPDLRKNDPNEKVGKLTNSKTKKELDKGTFKEDKKATESTRGEIVAERIMAGDKKAGKKAGLKGKNKRMANKAGKKVKKEGDYVGKQEKKISKLDISNEKDFAKADKLNKKASKRDTRKQKGKSKEKMQEIILSAATFKDFDQMDSKNAKKTAGESMAKAYESPINYFKQAIKYDVKEASNPSLSSSAKKHYAENAQHDMKSMGKMDKTMAYKHGAMKGDQSASRIDYANYKGTDKGYHGKTGASHGDQSASKADYMGKSKKGGSILSKHMKS